MKFFCIPLFACKGGVTDTLDFSQLRLEEVPREVLKSRKYVEELLLNVNSIEVLPPEFFRCTKLRKLDVSENKIKMLPKEIGALQSLMELNLSKNEFVEIPDEIGECRALVALDISTNIVPGLPKTIANLGSLTHLNVSNNSLTNLPPDIEELRSLVCLDAGQCELRSLPPSITRLFNLKILDLCENYLTELPSGMDGLVSLEILDLHNNMINRLPYDILKCGALRNLDVSVNQLVELPNNIGDLSNLTEFVVCDNQIGSLPSSIGQLKKLEILKASKNRICELTPAICSCSQLTDLILCENQLREIPSSIGNLKRLKFLDLNVNNLNHVPSTIGGCESLGVLSLRHNAIRDLPMEVGRLSRLQVLDLIENNLVHLPYTLTVLYQSKTLCALWLSFNQPPLPKLSVANEPVMNVKVLTCYLLPQKGVTQLPPPKANESTTKSCVGGARVCFAKEWESSATETENEVDEEKNLPIGKFERYDTPHPKPFAPKNRQARNSGDFSNIIAANAAVTDAASISAENGAQGENGSATPRDFPPSVETRPLRSVLKRRPQSIISQSTLQVAEEEESDNVRRADSQNSLNGNSVENRTIRMTKSSSESFGWIIVGGTDSPLYKGQPIGGIFVSHVKVDGPAERHGFRVDDQLLSVNGMSLVNVTHRRAVLLIREAGDDVEFVVQRQVTVSDSNDAATNADSAATEFVDENGLGRVRSPAADSPKSPPVSSVDIDIVTVTINRRNMVRGGGRPSPGFTITGSGNSEADPIRVGAVTPGSYASAKLCVGDRLLSVNGVNVKYASHARVANLLAQHSSGDVYLLVQRKTDAPPPRAISSFHGSVASSLPPKSGVTSPIQGVSSRLAARNRIDLTHTIATLNSQMHNSRSLPSIVAEAAAEESGAVAPPIPPKRGGASASATPFAFNKNRSMNSLIADIFDTEREKRFPTNGVQFNAKQAPPPPKASMRPPVGFSSDFARMLDRPLATSSPIPKCDYNVKRSTGVKPPTATSPSHIPLPAFGGAPSLASNNGVKANGKPHLVTAVIRDVPSSQSPSTATTPVSQIPQPVFSAATTAKPPPPPVAPKPKMSKEQLAFSSKISKFEEINRKPSSSTTALASSNGGRMTGIPMKKPLVSSQDLEKLKAEETARRLNGSIASSSANTTADYDDTTAVDDDDELSREGLDTIHALSNDACLSILLAKRASGSSLPAATTTSYRGPAVIRTRNAEIRAEKLAARDRQMVNNDNGEDVGVGGGIPLADSSTCSSPGTIMVPPDEASLSRASSSMSSIEQRAADLEKRQAWRQARLQSMDVESKRTDEVIKKLIITTSIPSSPIPSQ